jgi:HK97 family phage major capsid protein
MSEISQKITELQDERHANVKAMREILDAAHADGGRDLTAEERQEYDRLEERVDANGAQISRETKLRAAELELEERANTAGEQLQGETRDKAVFDSKEYLNSFVRYLRSGDINLDTETRSVLKAGAAEMRDQAKGTNNLGGYLVPTDFQKSLAMHAIQAGTVRRTRVNVIVTSNGEALQVPKTTAHGAAAWVAEGSASSGVDETFGQVTLNAYTSRRLIKVSVELVEDEAVGLIQYLGKAIGQAIGLLQNDAYLNGLGSGSGQPTGLIGQASSGKVGAAGQTLTVTADDIFDLFYAVGPQYRTNAEWMLADSSIKVIRKLKDSTNNYIWSPTSGVASVLANGAPDTLLGKNLWSDPNMPTMAANAKSILFGDFSAYTIRDVGRTGPDPDERPMGAFGVIRLNERFMDGLQVGFLGYHRTDGNLIDATGAVKYYANSAT